MYPFSNAFQSIFKVNNVKCLRRFKRGYYINGKVINKLRYADDTVLIDGSIENLQKIFNKVVTAKFKYLKNQIYGNK